MADPANVTPDAAQAIQEGLKHTGYSVREGPPKGEGQGPNVPDAPTGGIWEAQKGAAPPAPDPEPAPAPAAEGPTMESPWVVERGTVEDLMKPIVAAQTRQALLTGAAMGLAFLALVIAWQARQAVMAALSEDGEGDVPDPAA